MADGFAILLAYLAIGLVIGFYRLTTGRERRAWAHAFMGWFALGMVALTAYELMAWLLSAR